MAASFLLRAPAPRLKEEVGHGRRVEVVNVAGERADEVVQSFRPE
jgi:hypothetical protein